MRAVLPSGVLLVTIAGKEVGFGHLNRCVALAERAAARDVLPTFLIFGDDKAASRVRGAGFECSLQPLQAVGDPSSFAETGADNVEIVVADLSHPLFHQEVNRARESLAALKRTSRMLCLIDALGEQSLAAMIPAGPIDVHILPYVGALPRPGASWLTLHGPEYAILSSAFSNTASRVVRDEADRVLVTCGGSDPSSLTVAVLDGLERVEKRLHLRVVIGPSFGADLEGRIVAAMNGSKHAIALLHAPDSLAQHMAWCDIAVATSGLTKYELAATGTPAILCSVTSVDEKINRPFAKSVLAVDLGTDCTPHTVGEKVQVLLQDYPARARMSAVAQSTVDGHGADRLLSEIIRNSVARH